MVFSLSLSLSLICLYLILYHRSVETEEDSTMSSLTATGTLRQLAVNTAPNWPLPISFPTSTCRLRRWTGEQWRTREEIVRTNLRGEKNKDKMGVVLRHRKP